MSPPAELGLYLLDYRPEFHRAWGFRRQFGVMADKVEQIFPDAVTVGQGCRNRVNLSLLGFSRPRW